MMSQGNHMNRKSSLRNMYICTYVAPHANQFFQSSVKNILTLIKFVLSQNSHSEAGTYGKTQNQCHTHSPQTRSTLECLTLITQYYLRNNMHAKLLESLLT